MKKDSPYDIVYDAYCRIKSMDPQPTHDEIFEYAKYKEKQGKDHACGVVSYKENKSGYTNFLRYHDTWKEKPGGCIHIDIGYGGCLETLKLHLDKWTAPEFVEFVEKRRAQYGVKVETEEDKREEIQYHRYPTNKYGMFCFTEKHEVNGQILTHEFVHSWCLTHSESEQIGDESDDYEYFGFSSDIDSDTNKGLRCDRCGKLFVTKP